MLCRKLQSGLDSSSPEDPLTRGELALIKANMDTFLSDPSPEAGPGIPATERSRLAAFSILKDLILQERSSATATAALPDAREMASLRFQALPLQKISILK